MNYKEAKAIARALDKKITLYDLMDENNNIRIVAIQHMDRSYLEFWSACYKELNNDWIAIFTEHHGFHVYPKDEVEWVKEWYSPKIVYLNSHEAEDGKNYKKGYKLKKISRLKNWTNLENVKMSLSEGDVMDIIIKTYCPNDKKSPS